MTVLRRVHASLIAALLCEVGLVLAASDLITGRTRESVALSGFARVEGVALAAVGAVLIAAALLTPRAALRVVLLFGSSALLGLDSALSLSPLGAATPWSPIAAALAGLSGWLEAIQLRSPLRAFRIAATGVLAGAVVLAVITAAALVFGGAP